MIQDETLKIYLSMNVTKLFELKSKSKELKIYSYRKTKGRVSALEESAVLNFNPEKILIKS